MECHKNPESSRSRDGLKEAAHAYHGLGINVLAVKGKRPAGSAWERWQTERQTEDDLDRLLRAAGITGVSGITGPISGHRFCLDIDQAEGDGILLGVLKALGLRLTYEWTVETPGRGYHLWGYCSELDEALGDKGKLIGHLDGCKQVELRWKKHQTLLPPSLHPNGGEYRFRSGRMPRHPPKEVTWEALKRVAHWGGLAQPQQPSTAAPPALPGHLDPYIRAALVGEAEKVGKAVEGERNETLVRAAFALGQLEQYGLPFGVAETALAQAAAATGLKAAEIRSTIRSGWNAGQKEPRDIPGFSVPQMLEPPPAYPVDALPEPVRRYVIATSRAMGCPNELVAVPLVAYAGAAIGNTACLVVRSDWEAFPIVWTATVAPPGTAKSPADQAARKGLNGLQLEAKARYDEDMAQYKKRLAAFKDRPRKGKAEMKIADKYLKTPEERAESSATQQDLEPAEEPERPQLEHFYTTDATIEAVAPMLAHSAGVAICRDELINFVESFGAYKSGRGGERQAYLSLWSGTPLKVDRKGADTIFVPNPVCCVTGGIQPDVVHELGKEAGRRDGFVERFIVSFPETAVAKWSDEEIPLELDSELFRLFRELRRPGTLPRRISFSAEARRRWVHWYDENAAKTELSFGLAEGASAKMPVQCARLALILHCLLHGEKAGGMKLSLDTLKAAITLVEYHRAHGERLFALLGSGSDRLVRLREKLTLILKNADGRWLSRTELDRALGGAVEAKERDKALTQMKAEGLVEQTREKSGPQGGRPVERWRWAPSEELKNPETTS